MWLPLIYQFKRTGTNLDHPTARHAFIRTEAEGGKGIGIPIQGLRGPKRNEDENAFLDIAKTEFMIRAKDPTGYNTPLLEPGKYNCGVFLNSEIK